MCTVHEYILYNTLPANPSDNETLHRLHTTGTLLYNPLLQIILLSQC